MSRGDQFKTEDIIAAIRKTHGGVYLAADDLGCSYKTIERRAARVKAVRDELDKYRQRRSDVAELKLETAIMSGQPWAILFQLRTQGRARGYVERTENEISGKGGGPITFRVVYGDDGSDDPTA